MLFTKKAFTMIELVFVIVILGILAAVAIPRFAVTRTDAQISKGRADVASIRSGIITDRQSKLIKGITEYIQAGDATYTVDSVTYNELDIGTSLFGGVLTYGVEDSTNSGHWHRTALVDNNSTKYNYNVAGENVEFIYTRSGGIFTCNTTAGTAQAKAYCKDLIN